MTPTYFTNVTSPLGQITLTTRAGLLCGLYFANQRHWPTQSTQWLPDAGSQFDPARAWLDAYFGGDFTHPAPETTFAGGTAFQQRVWQALLCIAPGKTVSYGALAAEIQAPTAVRALGAAVGRNPISLIAPCHRVAGGSGKLTGYAGGLDRKAWLLNHEAHFTSAPNLPV